VSHRGTLYLVATHEDCSGGRRVCLLKLAADRGGDGGAGGEGGGGEGGDGDDAVWLRQACLAAIHRRPSPPPYPPPPLSLSLALSP
jgi:hypothetical protein